MFQSWFHMLTENDVILTMNTRRENFVWEMQFRWLSLNVCFFETRNAYFFYMNLNHDLAKRKCSVFYLSSCSDGDFFLKYDKHRIFFWTNKIRLSSLISMIDEVALIADNNHYSSIESIRFFFCSEKRRNCIDWKW